MILYDSSEFVLIHVTILLAQTFVLSASPSGPAFLMFVFVCHPRSRGSLQKDTYTLGGEWHKKWTDSSSESDKKWTDSRSEMTKSRLFYLYYPRLFVSSSLARISREDAASPHGEWQKKTEN